MLHDDDTPKTFYPPSVYLHSASLLIPNKLKSNFSKFGNLFQNIIKKRCRSNVVEKFRKFSDSVWVGFEALIIEKILKEE